MQFLTEHPVVFASVGILILFLVGMVLLGIRAQRYNRTFEDTITAGRSMNFWILVGSGVGAQVGSGFVLGGAEDGAAYGLGGAWYGISCGLGCILIGLFLAKYFRVRRYVSISDFLTVRYRDKRVNLLYVVSMIMCTFALVAGQLLAGQAILETFGVSGDWSVWVTLAVTFTFATLTGLWGAYAASAMQSVIILAGILLALGVMTAGNGTEVLTRELPERYFDLMSYDAETLVSIVFPMLTISLTGQMIVQRISATKSVRDAVAGHLMVGVLLIFLAFVPVLLGMYGRIAAPDVPAGVAFPALLMNRLPVLIAGIMLAAIMSSVVSAVCSSYILMNTLVIHDIYEGILGKTVTDQGSRRFMVVCNLAVSLIAVLLTRTTGSIIGIMSYGSSFVGSGCFAAIIGGMIWKRPDGRAAALSIVCSVGVSLLHLLGVVRVPFQSLTAFGIGWLVYLLLGALLPRRGEGITEERGKELA